MLLTSSGGVRQANANKVAFADMDWKYGGKAVIIVSGTSSRWRKTIRQATESMWLKGDN